MRKTKTEIMSMVVIGLSLVICNCSPFTASPQDTAFNIQGTVTDAQNGTPIADASVQIGSLSALYGNQMTNAEGYYNLKNCSVFYAGDTFTGLLVSRQGYKIQKHSIENTPKLQTINIALERETN
jgi:hypothetical protein